MSEKCPFKFCIDKSRAFIPKGIFLASYDDNNVAFGIGCRRCPGEEISLLYLYHLIKFYEKKMDGKIYGVGKDYIPFGLGNISWYSIKP